MKKVLFLMVLLTSVSYAFAQVKSVKEAKNIASSASPDFNKAEQLISGALTNPETKDNPDTWDVAGFVQKRINEEQMKVAYLKKPYDTIKVNNSVLKMFEYFSKCDDLAQIPDEKGKIKNRFRKSNTTTLADQRVNLINGGVFYYNKGVSKELSKEAFQYFSTYVESASYPMLAEKNYLQTDTLLTQIAYYATLAADRVGDKASVIKYASMGSKVGDEGKFALELLSEAYKSEGDTINFAKVLEEGAANFPTHRYFFANLVDYYSNSGQSPKAMEFANKMVESDPNNAFYLYVKAYLLYNMKDYDQAIVFYKKTTEVSPDYTEAYSNAGLAYLLKAQDYAADAPTNANDPMYEKSQQELKKLYEAAKPLYEKARELKPDEKELWLQGLYRVYYNLKMGPEFEEIDKMMPQDKKEGE